MANPRKYQEDGFLVTGAFSQTLEKGSLFARPDSLYARHQKSEACRTAVAERDDTLVEFRRRNDGEELSWRALAPRPAAT